MKKNKLYKINEIFYSLQCEGTEVGTPSIFIRFAGCNRSCHFCDTNFQLYEEYSIEQIVDLLQSVGTDCKNIIITGGEPLIQYDLLLHKKLKELGFHISIETNGDYLIPKGVEFDHITVSPKSFNFKLRQGHDLKIIYEKQDLNPYLKNINFKTLYLQPCFTNDLTITLQNIAMTFNFILKNPIFKLSLQIQKMINIQ